MINRDLLVYGLIVTILLLLTFAMNMVWTVVQQRQTATRVDRTLTAAMPAQAPLTGLINLLHGLGVHWRRFYAPSNLDHLRGMI